MIYRRLDAQRDMVFGGGDTDFYRDNADAVAQAVLTRLGLIYGEWFLDDTAGTPYQGGVMGKNTQASADDVIRLRILETQGVLEIVPGTFESIYEPNGRVLSMRCEINTIYGAATVTGVA